MTEKTQRDLARVLLVLIAIPLLAKIFTSDFGTHIALGREIVRTRSVAATEFLNYPSLGMPNPNGEWGFQAILYLVHEAGGAYGVSVLCWAVVLGIFAFLYRATVIRGANPLLAVLAIFAFSGFLRIRIQPRPELFTYLFTALTLYIFTEYFFGTRKKLIFLFPAVMLAWANMHPAYLMGFVLAGAFAADALIRAVWKRELRWARLKTWVGPPAAAGILGLMLCGFNPHGYDAIWTPLHVISRGAAGGGGGQILISISELTPVRQTGFYPYYKAAAAFAAISLVLGAIGRRLALIDIFLLAIAFKGAWDSARAVSMIGLFISPGAALHLTGFLATLATRWGTSAARAPEAGRRESKKEKRKGAAAPRPPAPRSAWAVPSKGWVAATALVVAALLAFGGTTIVFSFSQLQYGVGMTEHKFSFAAADFLRKSPVRGKMFNFFDIGGFLDWQLYPQALTFIDGRTYNKEVFRDHQTVTGAQPGWQEVLDRYGITYLVLKAVDSSGNILPVIGPLSASSEWGLVFADGLFLVFVRRTPENADYLRRHEISKMAIPGHIIRESHHYTYLGVSPVLAYFNMSNMYLLLGDREGAVRSLRTALDHNDMPFLRARLAELERGGGPSPAGGAR